MTDNTNFGAVLASPPNDGISSLEFSANSDLLLAASWDGVSAHSTCSTCFAVLSVIIRLHFHLSAAGQAV